MVILVLCLAILTIPCAYELYLLAGDRMKSLSRVGDAMQSLAEYQIGDTFGLKYSALMGIQYGQLVTSAEVVAIIAIRIFYPFMTTFLLMQFIAAILVDYLGWEMQRRTLRKLFDKKHMTNNQSMSDRLMHASGTFSLLRNHVSAALYAVGWKNLSAFFLSGNLKWLHPGKGMRGFQGGSARTADTYFADGARNAPTLTRVNTFSRKFTIMDDPSTPHARAHATKLFHSITAKPRKSRSLSPFQPRTADDDLDDEYAAADHVHRIMTSESYTAGQGETTQPPKKPKQDYSELPSVWVGGEDSSDKPISLRKDGLKSDVARYLRMNNAKDRYELVVPVIGLLGPKALADLLYYCFLLQNGESAATTTNLMQNELASKGAAMKVRVQDDSYRDFLEANTQGGIHPESEKRPFTTMMLKISNSLGERIIHDLGWRPGSEFTTLKGENLVMAVLRRARDTARGMKAISADTLEQNSSLKDVVIDLMRGGGGKAGLTRAGYLRSKLVRTVSRVMSGKIGVNRLLFDGLWKLFGLFLNAISPNEIGRRRKEREKKRKSYRTRRNDSEFFNTFTTEWASDDEGEEYDSVSTTTPRHAAGQLMRVLSSKL